MSLESELVGLCRAVAEGNAATVELTKTVAANSAAVAELAKILAGRGGAFVIPTAAEKAEQPSVAKPEAGAEKAEQAKPVEETTPAAEPVVEKAEQAEPSADKAEQEPALSKAAYTDQCRELINSLLSSGRAGAARAVQESIQKTYGVKRFGEVPQEYWPAVLASLKAELEAQA